MRPELVFHAPGWDDQLLRDLGDTNVSIENSVAISGNTLYFANSGGLVQGWDIAGLKNGVTPRRVFRFWTGEDTDASVVVDEQGYLYVGSELERHTGQGQRVHQIMKLDPRKPADPLVWSVKDDGGGTWATAGLYRDMVIVPTRAGLDYGIDRDTGKVLWVKRLPGETVASPAIVDGVWLQGDCTGTLHAYDLAASYPNEPKELWSLQARQQRLRGVDPRGLERPDLRRHPRRLQLRASASARRDPRAGASDAGNSSESHRQPAPAGYKGRVLSGRTARLAGLVLTALLGLMAQVGCDASAPPRTSGSSVAEAPQSGDSCTRYRPPDPNRPVVRLVFRIGTDHRTVTGSEHVAFRPGRVVRELVFRLWPNGPEGGRTRAWLTVSRARAAGRNGFDVTAAGARPGTQGTLLSLPLPAPAAPGSVVTADLDFAVHLPPPGWDRLGSDGRTAWWASAYPMLAWQQQGGWARDPASPLPGETATSEAADTRVTVMAPAADTVLTAGIADPPQPAAGRQRIWRFHAPTARDVAVAVGRFQLAAADVAGPAGTPTPVTVGVAPGVRSSARDVLAEVRRALPLLSCPVRPGPLPGDPARQPSRARPVRHRVPGCDPAARPAATAARGHP